MKSILPVLITLFLSAALTAQESQDSIKYWKKNGDIAINFSEVSFSNWAAGGKSSVSGIALFNFSANYSKNKINWENTFNFGFGLLKEGKNDITKSEDKIEISSKLGLKSNSPKFLYTTLFNIRSQFANGYNYPNTDNKISGLFSPAYLTVAVGVDHIASDHFSLFISPVSGKLTIVSDPELSNAGAFGVDKGAKSRSEFGALLKTQLKITLVKNVNLNSQLSLFSNYLENPENIDINWDLALNMKINDFLSANFISNLIYDHDIIIPIDSDNDGVSEKSGRKIQFKQLLGIGINYKF